MVKLKRVVALWSAFATEPLPVTREDYPFTSTWYMGFEKRVAFIIPYFVLPNYLTLFRVMASLFLIRFFSALSNTAFIIIAVAAALSDYFDGITARTRNQKTKLGVLLDPFADKLLVVAIIFMLLKRGGIDLRLVALILIGELHIILIPAASFFFQALKKGSYKPRIKPGERVKPVLPGRLKLYLYLFGFMFIIIGISLQNARLADIGRKMVLTGVGLSWIALAIYIQRWAKNPY